MANNVIIGDTAARFYKDVGIVMYQTKCSWDLAVMVLQRLEGNLGDALLYIQQLYKEIQDNDNKVLQELYRRRRL